MSYAKGPSDPELEGGRGEQRGIMGGLAQSLREGMRVTIEALGQSHAQRLAAIVENSDAAIISTDLNGLIATWNHGAQKLFGYAADEVIGQPITILMPEERQDEELGILARIRRGERVENYETERQRKDGRRIAISLTVSPIIDAAGRVVGASKIARDITQRKRAEAVQATLYQFTDRLFRATSADDVHQAALDAIVRALGCDRAAILMFDHAGVMKFVAWRGLSDGYRRAVEGHSPWTNESRDPQPIAIADIDRAEIDAALKATVKGEGIGALAFIPLFARGRLVGKFMAYYPASHDFTKTEIDLAVTIARQLGFSVERMQAEHAKELVRNEGKHRIKNMLAMVQAIAGQTLRSTSSDELQAFRARLQALAEANDLLTMENVDEAPVREVVERALKPFEPAERIDIQGPNLTVSAKTSLLLTMCLHELATNAAKYGALSNGSGRVHLGWKPISNAGDRKIKFCWRETGGPRRLPLNTKASAPSSSSRVSSDTAKAPSTSARTGFAARSNSLFLRCFVPSPCSMPASNGASQKRPKFHGLSAAAPAGWPIVCARRSDIPALPPLPISAISGRACPRMFCRLHSKLWRFSLAAHSSM